jgi:hypothetical protein
LAQALAWGYIKPFVPPAKAGGNLYNQISTDEVHIAFVAPPERKEFGIHPFGAFLILTL